MHSSHTIYTWITDTISVNYAQSHYDDEKDEYVPTDESHLMVVFHKTDISNFVTITKGDDAYYSPIYPSEVEEVRKEYGDSYVSEGYSLDAEIVGVDENGHNIYDPSKKSYHLLEQPDYWYVHFTNSNIGSVAKFKDVESAIKHALIKTREYISRVYNDIGYMLFNINFDK